MTPSEPPPFELLDTRVFDDMRSRGQLHLLDDIRMDVVFCYTLIRKYNMDRDYKPNHLDLLTELHKWLDKAIRDLEAKFKFLPHYVRDKNERQEAQTENEVKDSRGQKDRKTSVHDSLTQKGNMLSQWVKKYSVPVFGVVAGISICLLLFLAISFTSHSNIKLLLGLGFVCDSLATATALYVALFGAGRKWFILAIEFFIFGMFFKLFGLL